jgi:hypothetical protein
MSKNLNLLNKIQERFGSQAEFSMNIPEDETVISRVILGRRKLNSERQERWAEVLKCRVEEIFN